MFNIAAEKLPSPPKKRSSFPTIKFSEVVEGGSSGPWYVCVFCVFLFRNDESFNQIFGASSYHTSEYVGFQNPDSKPPGTSWNIWPALLRNLSNLQIE